MENSKLLKKNWKVVKIAELKYFSSGLKLPCQFFITGAGRMVALVVWGAKATRITAFEVVFPEF